MQKNSLFLILLLAFASVLQAQSGKLDELKGYGDLRVGEDIKRLAAQLKLKYVETTDPYSGAPDAYYAFKNLAASEYAVIFETKVQEIKIREEGGEVVGISISFDPMGSLDKLSSAFAGYYDADLGCAIAVMDPEWGGCYLDGSEVSFSIERIEDEGEPSPEEDPEWRLHSPIHVGIRKL